MNILTKIEESVSFGPVSVTAIIALTSIAMYALGTIH